MQVLHPGPQRDPRRFRRWQGCYGEGPLLAAARCQRLPSRPHQGLLQGRRSRSPRGYARRPSCQDHLPLPGSRPWLPDEEELQETAGPAVRGAVVGLFYVGLLYGLAAVLVHYGCLYQAPRKLTTLFFLMVSLSDGN